MNKIPGADLEVGDTLHRREGHNVLITRLNPPTRDAALAYGEREVWSGSSVVTVSATEPVDATPSLRRMAAALGWDEVSA
jgi:hypothetical protein